MSHNQTEKTMHRTPSVHNLWRSGDPIATAVPPGACRVQFRSTETVRSVRCMRNSAPRAALTRVSHPTAHPSRLGYRGIYLSLVVRNAKRPGFFNPLAFLQQSSGCVARPADSSFG